MILCSRTISIVRLIAVDGVFAWHSGWFIQSLPMIPAAFLPH